MVVQNNLHSLNAYNKLNVNVTGLNKSSEKLSSGYRINRAGDDAAGLAMSEKMRSQLKGLTQGVKNIQDGINLLQTADGALSTVHDMIHRLSQLSEQSANGSYSLIERESIQQEVDQILEEIDQTSDYVIFNSKSVFGGSGSSASKTASAVSAAVSDATAAVTSENTPQPTTRSSLERNNAAMSALVADAPEETDFTPLMAMNENVLKVRSYAAAPLAANVTQCGDLIVTGGTLGTDFKYENNTLTILTSTAVEISGTTTTDKIYVEDGVSANITLNNLNIDIAKGSITYAFQIADNSKGNVHLTLKGNNTLIGSGGLIKNGGVSSGTLTIDGDGSIRAESLEGEIAGIGSCYGKDAANIIINSGTVTAVSTDSAAGIGSGMNGDASNITINGGIVTAQAVSEGAGIGSGFNGDANNITITGGNITAICKQTSPSRGKNGAGIGSGEMGSANNITITNATVVADGGGAGIGSGSLYHASLHDIGTVSNITIKNSKITAIGGSCAGIGGGSKINVSNITITDSDVTATSRVYSGIGGGNSADVDSITISGSKVIATGGEDTAGIGGGHSGNVKNIIINDSDVTATGSGGAGIGGGSYGKIENIKITGGTIKASSSKGGAGIGSGKRGSLIGGITIKNADVTASVDGGGRYSSDGPGIGGQSGDSGANKIAISDSVINATGKHGIYGCNDGDIIINNSDITAVGNHGVGIGGDMVNDIIINGGRITATGVYPGIGGIYSFNSITINSGTIKAISEESVGIGTNSYGDGVITIRGSSTVVYAVAKTTDKKPIGDGFKTNTQSTINRYSGLIIEGDVGYIYGGDVTIKDDFTIENGVYVHVDGERTEAGSHSLTIDNGVTLTNNGTIHVYLHDKLPINGTVVNNGLIIYEPEVPADTGNISGGGTVKGQDPSATPEPPKPDNPVDPNPNPDPPDPPDPPGPDKPDPPEPGKPDKPGGNTPGGSNGTGSGSGYGSDSGVTEWQSVWQLQVGARTKDTMFVEIGAMNTGILGIRGLDVTDQENANRAIDLTAAALNKISAMRSTIGAQQNRLEHKLSNTVNVKENLTQSESSIRDTEMAAEVLYNTKYKILLQASQIILMQSNEVPQSALQLLG